MTDWMAEFKRVGAVWIHDGHPERPFALLTSGRCSNGFVNCTFVTQRPGLLRRIVASPDGLAPLLPSGKVDWVIGSAFGAVTLAYVIAEKLGAKAGFTQKKDEGMELARFTVEPGERVLIVEDTISTGGSTQKTIAAIEEAAKGQAELLSVIVCLVNRSGKDELDGRQIRPLLKLDIQSWTLDELKKKGRDVKVVRPKDHWQELTMPRS